MPFSTSDSGSLLVDDTGGEQLIVNDTDGPDPQVYVLAIDASSLGSGEALEIRGYADLDNGLVLVQTETIEEGTTPLGFESIPMLGLPSADIEFRVFPVGLAADRSIDWTLLRA